MNREEAITVLKKVVNPKVKEAIETLIPELRESEDERIRKWLYDYIERVGRTWGKPGPFDYTQILAWLEKQKVIAAIPDELVECYKNLCERGNRGVASLINAINGINEQKEQKPVEPSDEELVRHPPISYTYPSNASRDEQLKMALLALLNSDLIKVAGNKFTKQDLIDWVEKRQEQKPMEWKPQPESLEALMYAIEGKWDMIPPTSYLSRRLEDLYEGLVNTYHVDESLITELHKAASEEDEKMLTDISWAIRHCAYSDMKKERVMKWFNDDYRKFLRPHWKPSEVCYGVKGDPDPAGVWKPSEEQMEALQHAIDACESEWAYEDAELRSLLADLKKITRE